MPQFSRRTVLAATDVVANWSHSSLDRFALEHGLENVMQAGSRANRAMNLARHLIQNPDAQNEDGANLVDFVVSEIVNGAIASSGIGYPRQFSMDEFRSNFAALQRGLERDGFTVDDGTLRRALPQALDLPAADDEVHSLLTSLGFLVPLGHLDQGIAAHSRGDWAAANGQFRSFIESLFDCLAEHLNGGRQGIPDTGNQRRQWLANRGFFSTQLNEWDGQGHGFIEAFFRRLHPAGAHPGLSDQDDSTFRLHAVLLVARLLLRRV
jgi:hypothetical protein